MDDLYDLIKRYTFRYDRKIKTICKPLEEGLDIQFFCYNYIEKNGRFGTLSNIPEELDFYYSEKVYQDYPFHRCPSLLRSGIVISQTSYNERFYDLIYKKFKVAKIFTMVEKRGDRAEFFLFAHQRQNIVEPNFYTDLPLLRKFTRHFKKEAASIITPMLQEGYNLKKAKGEAFTQVVPNFPLSNLDLKKREFLKKIWPLTEREKELMKFLRVGMSSQATASHIGLAQKTVEHYYDNIKNKLGCETKSQLLEWCDELFEE